MQSMVSSLSYAVLFSILLQIAISEIDFPHCDGPIDLGGNEEQGKIHGACVKNHNFHDEHHAWILTSTKIKDTNFTSCTFQNIGRTIQSFWGTTWENVIFRDTVFTTAAAGPISPTSKSSFISPSLTLFHNVSFRNVEFINCTFHKGVDIVFLEFSFIQVSFQQCTFLGAFYALRGMVRDLAIRESTFGPISTTMATNSSSTVNASVGHQGDFYFAFVRMSDIDLRLNEGTMNELAFGSATIDGFQLSYSSLGRIQCEVPIDSIVQLDIPYQCDANSRKIGCADTMYVANINDTLIRNVTFHDGIYCNRLTADELLVRNVTIQNKLDLSNSFVIDLTLDNIFPFNSSQPSNVSLAGSTIKRERIANIYTTNISLSDTTFTDAILFLNVRISDDNVDVRNALFVQERIGGECCSTVCETRRCVCGMSHEPIWCPQANVTTRSAKYASCFPADGYLWTEDDSGKTFQTRMDSVTVGMRAAGLRTAATDNIADKKLGKVFFFGHKDGRGTDVFVSLHIIVQREQFSVNASMYEMIPFSTRVRLSRGHLIPIVGRGYIVARAVKLGDQLMTIWGPGYVTGIEEVWGVGLFSPVTTSGDMIVDGVLVSCFTEAVDHITATALLAPLRWMLQIPGIAAERRLAHVTWLHHTSQAHLADALKLRSFKEE